MATVKSGLYKVNERVDTIASDVAAVQSDITTIEGDISNLQSDVSSQSSNITSLQGSVSSLSSSVSTLSGQVSTLDTTVSNQGSSINTLNTQVSSLQTNVTTLQDQSNKLKFKVVSTFNAADLYASKDYNGGLLVWDDTANYVTDELNLFAQGFVSSSSGGLLVSDAVRVANVNQSNKTLTVKLSKKLGGYDELLISHGSESCVIVHNDSADKWILLNGRL